MNDVNVDAVTETAVLTECARFRALKTADVPGFRRELFDRLRTNV